MFCCLPARKKTSSWSSGEDECDQAEAEVEHRPKNWKEAGRKLGKDGWLMMWQGWEEEERTDWDLTGEDARRDGDVMWHKHEKKTWHLFWNDANNASILQWKNKFIYTQNHPLQPCSSFENHDCVYVLQQPVFLYPSFKVFPNIITISSFRDAYGLICHWDASTSEHFIKSNVGHPSLSHPAQSFVTWDRYF